MKKNALVALLAIALIAAGGARGQDKSADLTDMQALRSAAQADKRALVASTLKLTDAEAKRFWPIYENYQRSVDMYDRRRTRAIIEVVGLDRNVSDAFSKNLALELIASDEGEIKARRTMQNRLMRALPPKKVVRYMQLESKIRAIEGYDVASSLPMVK